MKDNGKKANTKLEVRDTEKHIGNSVNRNFKDTLFRMIFREKENLLSLYNAVNGTFYTNSEDLEIVTLENAIYMNMKNDVSFIMIDYLNMYEHQSTFNPNMPLRDLFYISREYEKLVDKKSLYFSTPIKIPTPRFVVFYNGTEELPEKQILKLSDLFQIPDVEPELELKVHLLNINLGHNIEILKQCKLLEEYMQYIQRVRGYAKDIPIEQAVDRAVSECIREGILAEFLEKFRREAIQVSIFEYDEERELRLIRQNEREQGLQEGLQRGRNNILLELINKKRKKGEAISQIAMELEETEETILEIIAQGEKVES